MLNHRRNTFFLRHYLNNRSTLDIGTFGYKRYKVKWSRYRPGVAQRVGRGIALLFHDHGTRRGWWSAARPGCTLPPGKNRYPSYKRMGGPQGWSGPAENTVPTGIRSQAVQPVVSHYTDWATRPTYVWLYRCKSTEGMFSQSMADSTAAPCVYLLVW